MKKGFMLLYLTLSFTISIVTARAQMTPSGKSSEPTIRPAITTDQPERMTPEIVPRPRPELGKELQVNCPQKGLWPTWSQKISQFRFLSVLDGEAYLDCETGLVWEKSPAEGREYEFDYYRFGAVNEHTGPGVDWFDAMNWCQYRLVGERYGWRVPTIEELTSLLGPNGLPKGHPFKNVDPEDDPTNETDTGRLFWSSTTYAPRSDGVIKGVPSAWLVHLARGPRHVSISIFSKNWDFHGHGQVWCVRGGQAYDGGHSLD